MKAINDQIETSKDMTVNNLFAIFYAKFNSDATNIKFVLS